MGNKIEAMNGVNYIDTVPDDILINILVYVDLKSLLRCRRVCSNWKLLVDDYVWKAKLKASNNLCLKDVVRVNSVIKSPMDFYILNKLLNKNLLKNPCGARRFAHWSLVSNGGDQWKVEHSPAGSDPLPTEVEDKYCFATSYGLCAKEQIVKLAELGVSSTVMDALQPQILIKDWYAGRFDCGCTYNLQVTLLDKNLRELHIFIHDIHIEQWLGKEWHKVEHTFEKYGPGVRYISFLHKGQDCEFWAGHYGSKMTGSSVILSLKSSTSAKASK